MIPIAAVDPLKAVELAGAATAWLARVLAERRSKQERGAAMLLRELGVLALSAHALNNAARAVTAPLLRYRADWSDEERQRVFDDLDAFLNDCFIVPELDRTIAALQRACWMLREGTLKLDDAVRNEVDDLERIVENALEFPEWIRGDEMDQSSHLTQLWRRLDAAQRAGDPLAASAQAVEQVAEQVAAFGQDVRDPVSRAWLADVDARLGRLRAVVGMRHAKIPTPEWLSGFSPASPSS